MEDLPVILECLVIFLLLEHVLLQLACKVVMSEVKPAEQVWVLDEHALVVLHREVSFLLPVQEVENPLDLRGGRHPYFSLHAYSAVLKWTRT